MTPSQTTDLSLMLAGATGLVGRYVLSQALEDPAFTRVVVIGRRPVPKELSSIDSDGKLEDRLVDFDRLEDTAGEFRADAVVCALGTTMKKAGSKEAFRQVDLEYPLSLARLGLKRGARHYLLVSALGADEGSRFFYNRVKGEVEARLRELPYESITIVRPSLLLGDRGEFRLGEEIAKRLSFLIPPKYKPIPARAVAHTLVLAAKDQEAGTSVIESRDMRREHRSSPSLAQSQS